MSLPQMYQPFYVKLPASIGIRLMICLIGYFASLNTHADPSTAFFYGKPVPVDLLSEFQQVVVEPENVDDIDPPTRKGTRVFAYLSVGEVNPSRAWFGDIPKSWMLGENGQWGSTIMDVSLKDWQNYLIEKQVAPLWKQGYRGFFLDTLDSYQLVVVDHARRLAQQQALVEFIQTLHRRFPGIKLILNRGFELLPLVSAYVSAVAVESLFQAWNPKLHIYEQVVDQDRYWLLDKLNKIRKHYGLQIIVIDYVAPKERDLARKVAHRISELGFTPWVSNVSMDMIGIGAKEVFPKRFLIVYDGQAQLDKLVHTNKYKFWTAALKFMGYTFEYLDARQGLPYHCLAGQYTKIVTLLNVNRQSERYTSWLKRQTAEGLDIIQVDVSI
jgi:uncharacterized protein (TIGR01370 family)